MTSNVADLLRQAAAREPDKVALSEATGGRAVSFAALDELVDRMVTGLADSGVRGGQRVLIATRNRIEFVVTYLAVLRARAIAVPVSPRSTTGELLRMLVDSGARVVVADETTESLVRDSVAGVTEALAAGEHPMRVGATEASAVPVAPAEQRPQPPLVITMGTPQPGEARWADLVTRLEPPVPAREDPEALAALLYTGGTSGRPRAAMLSHRALLANIEQVARVDPPMMRPGDVVLGVLPLCHIYGLNAVLGQCLNQCARLVLEETFDPEGTLDLIEDEAITVLPVAPAVFAYWRVVPGLEERLGPVRVVLSGSAPLAPQLSEEFTERTGLVVHQGYGLTETAPVVTSTMVHQGTVPTGSVGSALPGVELRLADTDGREPASQDGGEILVRGDNLFSGYWPDGADGPGPDGWFATGDVGYLDEAGDLVLVDRVPDLINVSGFNVYPSEVEDRIREIDEVSEVAVVGADDESTGERVVAYVRPRHVREVDRDELAGRVHRHCTGLARFKQPLEVHVVDELPTSVTGRVQRGRLRSRARRSTELLE